MAIGIASSAAGSEIVKILFSLEYCRTVTFLPALGSSLAKRGLIPGRAELPGAARIPPGHSYAGTSRHEAGRQQRAMPR